MRSFDLTPQIERLVASGLGRIQRISDDVYRKLWPATVEMPARYEGRFDRALCVDAFPLHPLTTVVDDAAGRPSHRPVRLLPLPGFDKPKSVMFGRSCAEALMPADFNDAPIRYILFWQAGERWKTYSPNTARSRFDADECGLRLNEGLHLPLQEEALLRKRRLPLVAHMNAHGETYFAAWDNGPIPTFHASYGMFVEMDGVPSRAKEVIVVSTEDQDFFLKD